MKIGDKVRLLRSNDEGRIVRFSDKNLVEIEIEQGFVIPAMRSEVVVVSGEENEYFGHQTSTTSSTAATREEAPETHPGIRGIFLGFIPINDNDVSLYLFNFSNHDILYSISESHDGLAKAYAHGACSAGKNQFVTYFKLSNFESWPEILAQVITINQRLEPRTSVIEGVVKLKAKSFFNSKTIIPTIDKEGFLIEIKDKGSDAGEKDHYERGSHSGSPVHRHEESQAETLSKQLKTKLMSPKASSGLQATLEKKAGKQLEVDLHIEKIDANHQQLTAEEIINKQIATFEKALDNAILTDVASVKFIHGIGNGSLRHKIHKHLSQSHSIRYFEDADKGKFGFGATVVHL